MKLEFIGTGETQIALGSKRMSVGDCITCDGISTPTKITRFGWNLTNGVKIPTKIILNRIVIELNNEGEDDRVFLSSITVSKACRNKTTPVASTERVMVGGRARIVYVDSKGGRFIKSKETFVSFRS